MALAQHPQVDQVRPGGSVVAEQLLQLSVAGEGVEAGGGEGGAGSHVGVIP